MEGFAVVAKTSTELPPNIKEFSQIAAVIFSELYKSFPVGQNVDLVEVAKVLRISDINSTLPSGRSFNLVFINTLNLLIREGFVPPNSGHWNSVA